MTAIGDPITRIDGKAKVTGEAKYAAEWSIPNVATAVIVTSTIPNGHIERMDVVAAERAPGIIAVMTPANAPRLPQGGKAGVNPPAGRVLSLLQDTDVLYNNQPIAVVIAETLEQAQFAATLVRVRYQQSPAKLDFEAGFKDAHPGGHNDQPADLSVGQFDQAIVHAEEKVDEIYTTPVENHNPMEPHATIAQWDGDNLTVHDSTQYISGVKQTLAKAFGIPEDNVHTICPYTGGGFGCKGSTWSHVVLAAMASRGLHRPVKIVLDREQMFGSVGSRPQTYQHIVLGAKRDGTLVALRHQTWCHTSVFEDYTEPSSAVSRMLYACPVIDTSIRLVKLNVGTPTFQRAPGESTGTFGLESAMDELAYKLKMDPIELRLKNYAEKDPTSNKPFSSKHLRECYAKGAESFGWSRRATEPRSLREGHELIGYGMATATYPANRSAAAASVEFQPNGRVTVLCGSQDLGTGTYTIMAQTAAATLKMPIDRTDAKLGSSMLPKSPVSGGSQTAASVLPAVQAAARQAQLKLLTAVVADPRSPLHGLDPQDLDFEEGQIIRKGQAGSGEVFTDFIARNGNKPIGATAAAEPDQDAKQYSIHSFGAVFAEVAVDESLGTPRVRRILGAYDVGTLFNEKLGKSQLIGGIVWGVSMALHEAAYLDSHTGRFVNNNLAEYHVPVNADIGEIEVISLNFPDTKFDPLGGRGIGEIGITGAGAAVANAIFNATGKRIRSAPITPDLLMT
jgi:xanthine dehydrogenase YagR molybdenum-binding subunit